MVLKRRRRVVTFRLSEEEYATLKQGYLESDFRSISEFARAAVLERLSLAGAPEGLLVGNLTVVTRELAGLDKATTESMLVGRLLTVRRIWRRWKCHPGKKAR